MCMGYDKSYFILELQLDDFVCSHVTVSYVLYTQLTVAKYLWSFIFYYVLEMHLPNLKNTLS